MLLQHNELIPCGDVCGLNLSTNVMDEASHILTSSPDEANLRFSCMAAPTNSLKQYILKNKVRHKKKVNEASNPRQVAPLSTSVPKVSLQSSWSDL